MLSLDFIIRNAFAGSHRRPGSLDFIAQEVVIGARLALALYELAHQFTEYL